MALIAPVRKLADASDPYDKQFTLLLAALKCIEFIECGKVN
ncbi:hypothetical protein [Polynucleobacter sp. IMCC 30228]|nr:hypothetical protein [Polynucleobacter sp. IMCC 30228]